MSEMLFPELDEDLDDVPDLDAGDATCRRCGCSELDACQTEHGACFWLEPDLCSACASEGT